jgi:Tape measure protein
VSAGGTSRIQLILQGTPGVMAGLKGVAGQVGALHSQVTAYNATVKKSEERSWLFNQAMFTMRRFAYGATLAVGALASASVYMGIKFNVTMEQNTIAMAHFLGGTAAATRELDRLYEVAARTPFEFQNVVEAERRFLAFGYSLEESRKALSVIGDVAAGLGGEPAENISRLVLVMGQVKATGRILGQDMLQLQQLGIDTNRIFREELGLTREDLAAGVGELQIPSEIAIPALLRGMQKQFKGMAEEQSKTLGGMLSTLRDYRNQFLGAMTEPITDRLRERVVPGLIALTQELSTAAKAGASFTTIIGILDNKLGARGGLLMIWKTIRDVGIGIGNVFTNAVVPAFRIAFTAAYPLFFILKEMAAVFRILSEHTIFAGIIFGVLGTIWVYTTTIMLAYTVMMMRQTFATMVSTVASSRFGIVLKWLGRWILLGIRRIWGMIFAEQAYAVWTARATGSTWLFSASATGGTVAMGFFQTAMWTAILSVRAFVIDLNILKMTIWSIPLIGWALAVISAMIYLELRFQAISRWLQFLWDKMRAFTDWTKGSWVGRLVGGAVNIAAGAVPFVGPVLQGGGHVAGQFAGGGVAGIGGRYLVGERGPELVTLPRGAQVTPNNQTGKFAQGYGTPEYIEMHTHVNLDGREMAEVVSKYKLSRAARQ